jgi:hypothetical protein
VSNHELCCHVVVERFVLMEIPDLGGLDILTYLVMRIFFVDVESGDLYF